MLASKDAATNVAVRDLSKAKSFYEGVLGLTPIGGEAGEVLAYRSGMSTIYVYKSDYAGTNKATTLTWNVDEVRDVVNDLKAKGIEFEHYDMPGMELDGDVHVGDDMKVAWFKDPDGNILSVASH